MADQPSPVVVQPSLKATVEVPSQPVIWYKPISEAAGALTAVFGLLAWVCWVVVKISGAGRDIKDLKHDLKNAETKIDALDRNRQEAEKTLVSLKETTKNLERSMEDLKAMVTRVLDAVTQKAR